MSRPRGRPPGSGGGSRTMVCGNPLFLGWMEEFRLEAQEKNLKSAESYGKACKSLASCPVTYERPRELLCLAGIGAKTVEMLEKKWRAWCVENGRTVDPSPERRKKATRPRSSSPVSVFGSDLDVSTKKTKTSKSKTTKAAPKAPKAYIPQPRSGAYAILLALVLAIDAPLINTQVYMTKSELSRAAQPFSDSSFTHSDKGGYYTAWNSMKTLVGKGYVYATGNPQRYCLTEEGYDVACAVRALHPDHAHIVKTPFLHEAADNIAGPSRLPALSSSRPHSPSPPRVAPVPARARPAPRVSAASSDRPERFQFWYISSTGQRVEALDEAMVRLDPEEFVNLRKVEIRQMQRDHPFVRQLRMLDAEARIRDDSGKATLFGYLLEEGAPPRCSKFQETSIPVVAKSNPSTAVAKPQSTLLDKFDGIDFLDDDDFLPTPDDTDLIALAAAPKPKFRKELVGSTFSRTNSAPIGSKAARLATNETSSLSSIDKPPISRPGPRLSSHMPTYNPLETDSPSSSTTNIHSTVPYFSPSSAIVFPPDSYDIILIIDTREVESRSNRDRIAESLTSKGVHVETRALRLGDMCWIARKRDGMGGEEDECVLDYVVERKRLDDLCGSIRDGRYTEQCHRLGNSAIRNVYYIVEAFQTEQRMETNGLQIMTAKSQIQVHNQFFLKETHKLSETIDFLCTMTNVIKSLHSRTALKIIPTRFLSRPSYKALQDRLREATNDPDNDTDNDDSRNGDYLISYEAHQTLNDKSASSTLREKFARMLLTVRGMSAERVSAVLDVWDTPRAMWEAMVAHDRAWERLYGEGGAAMAGAVMDKGKGKNKIRAKELFFADKVQGEGRRKIGDALSRDMYGILMGTKIV